LLINTRAIINTVTQVKFRLPVRVELGIGVNLGRGVVGLRVVVLGVVGFGVVVLRTVSLAGFRAVTLGEVVGLGVAEIKKNMCS
jgi:hypothetical protein